MTVFHCHNCGFSSKKAGDCPKCGNHLSRTCPVCGLDTEMCTCTADIPQTKGHPRH